MALLVTQVESDTFYLVGRWRSNTLLRYFYTTTKRFTEILLAKMFEHGTYALILSAHARN